MGSASSTCTRQGQALQMKPRAGSPGIATSTALPARAAKASLGP
jgi:hypothetical protein